MSCATLAWPIGSGDLLGFTRPPWRSLNPGDLLDIYWAGRTTMVTRRDHIAVYDRVFRSFFLDYAEKPMPDPVKLVLKQSIDRESVGDRGPRHRARNRLGKDEEEARLGLMASDIEIWRNKAFAACTPEELAALRRIMARIRVIPPRRRSPSHPADLRAGARPDLRRTVRTTMRTHGEPSELFWRERKLKDATADPDPGRVGLDGRLLAQPAPVRLLDEEGGLARSRCSASGRGSPGSPRRSRSDAPDDALDEAAQPGLRLGGGTRIGHALDTFVRDWGRRGLSRGAIVVICSDGLDRGDPAVLAGAMERLSRLSHKVVWMNPHKGTRFGVSGRRLWG